MPPSLKSKRESRLYDKRFFDEARETSGPSARQIVPIVMRLVQPQSVVDLGCGTGSWLAVFREQNVPKVLGIDGGWVDRRVLEIPVESFMVLDLTKTLPALGAFDLALSLEVAEHLPARAAETHVESLVSLAPAVMFSAAIPMQGGAGHVNEQWPEYWAERFAAKGYQVVDCIRRRVWNNSSVSWWFAQNTLLFVREDYLAAHPALRTERDRDAGNPLSLVHPGGYLQQVDPSRMSARQTIGLLPKVLARAVGRRLRQRAKPSAR